MEAGKSRIEGVHLVRAFLLGGIVCSVPTWHRTSHGQARTRRPSAPVFQTLATLTDRSNYRLCQHLDHAKESESILVSANVSAWWNQSGIWMCDRWHPQLEKKQHAASPVGESTGHRRTSGSSRTIFCSAWQGHMDTGDVEVPVRKKRHGKLQTGR
ncbi:endogenous retroviral envelope protein HEMO [Lemur catta]|uniref:endogenous retroviral envelope protein HEMO n=1 Tax=Lemur catta TaxID=9447 RepID=UPI001E26B3EC|nr:endogenous retroviral envelope protein HEMO [Lemur catta]